MVDPAKTYDEVREKEGEAAAAKAVIGMSKNLVGFALGVIILLVGGGLGLLLYGQGRIASCRDIVETNYESGVGAVIVEYRATGQLSDLTFEQFLAVLDDMARTDEVCPSGFWPWELPNEPNLSGVGRDLEERIRNGSTPLPDSTDHSDDGQTDESVPD